MSSLCSFHFHSSSLTMRIFLSGRVECSLDAFRLLLTSTMVQSCSHQPALAACTHPGIRSRDEVYKENTASKKIYNHVYKGYVHE